MLVLGLVTLGALVFKLDIGWPDSSKLVCQAAVVWGLTVQTCSTGGLKCWLPEKRDLEGTSLEVEATIPTIHQPEGDGLGLPVKCIWPQWGKQVVLYPCDVPGQLCKGQLLCGYLPTPSASKDG